jgi:hypothetical protein
VRCGACDETGSAAIRFYHFTRGLNCWEDEPIHLPLVSLTDTQAVFEKPERSTPRRITYRLMRPDELLVELTGVEESGDESIELLNMRRVRR